MSVSSAQAIRRKDLFIGPKLNHLDQFPMRKISNLLFHSVNSYNNDQRQIEPRHAALPFRQAKGIISCRQVPNRAILPPSRQSMIPLATGNRHNRPPADEGG